MDMSTLNYQSEILEKEKQLLICRCELEAMISENKLREIRGESPAYGEDAFLVLQQRIIENTRI